MILADFHTHSDNSPDGENTVIEICESAVNKGLTYLAVTDHCEIDSFYKDRYNIGYRQSYIEAKKAMEIYINQLIVRTGVEIGQATADTSIAESVTKLPYDVVLGSTHCLLGMDDFAFINYKKNDPKELLARYFKEELHLVDWGGFDVLTHLTYPLRYINGEQGFNLKTEDFGDEIEKVLKAIIKRGIALEINTSGLRQQLKQIIPDLFCIKLYKSLGGELLTIGSDAHRMEDIGANLKQGIELAKEAGYDKYCVYKSRRPEFISI